MSDFTISKFWKPRLGSLMSSTATVKGWVNISAGLDTFVEAPLILNSDLTVDPYSSRIILIAAPGAVGKSTLAREIAQATGAVYIDLAEADPVGGNTLSGGLAKSGLFAAWQENRATVLIDGLDEARLRVTQEAFEAFLGDVAAISAKRELPVILLGRTGAVQDAWLMLSQEGIGCAVFEIGFYPPEDAKLFAERRLRALRQDTTHVAAERRAIVLVLEKLKTLTSSDGERFAGYAPVLQAVAQRIATEANAQSLVSSIEAGQQPITLRSVANSILKREQEKLRSIDFEDSRCREILYTPNEQLERLAARLLGQSSPPLPPLGPKDAALYSEALDTWLAEHPFLDGATATSSAVFDAVISAAALVHPVYKDAALQRELRRGAAANPFLSEFYLPGDPEIRGGDVHHDAGTLQLSHVGAIYSSIRATLGFDDSANLTIDEIDGDEQEDALRVDVEIGISRAKGARNTFIKFRSELVEALKFGSHVEDVEITASLAAVEIGGGQELVMVAPILMQVDKISVLSERCVVEAHEDGGTSAVFLEAAELKASALVSTPILRGSVNFAVAWPGAKMHPWTPFSTDPLRVENPLIDEALRRFRKFIIAFRSHSKGSLARYRRKLEHERMTKGSGARVLKLLCDHEIVMLRGAMYHLDADRLGSLAGATYKDCMQKKFSAKTVAFIERALN